MCAKNPTSGSQMQDFDRNWAGPPELEPRDYRTQSDKDTWMSVCVENEYDAPQFTEDDVIIDIGANIGSFCYRAWMNGSRKIHGFEPWSRYWEQAARNIVDCAGITIHMLAVSRSDIEQNLYHDGKMSTMGDGAPVGSVSLDTILSEIDSVRFLKIDCEGAEWGILSTCTKLDRVQEIAGEYHLGFGCSVPDLSVILWSAGFSEMYFINHNNATGGFHAKR